MTRREMICGLASGAALEALPSFAALRPRLTFGILSDMHITDTASAEETVEALRYFRTQGVEAVVFAGDMLDSGLVGELKLFARAWFSVFPNGCDPQGRRVELLTVLGNHDCLRWDEGWAREVNIPWARVLREDLDRENRLAFEWRRLFGEEYRPIWMKAVNGIRFVGSSYQYRSDGQRRVEGPGEESLAGFMERFRADLIRDDVFFFVQHMHPRGTCSAPWAWGQDDGTATEILETFPNAIALSGHSHTPLNDERTIWRGAFTSVGTGALRFLIPFGGRENSEIDGDADPGDQLLPRLRPYDGKHGMVARVYDDHVAFERRDFANGLSLGADWFVPIPARAASLAERAKATLPPQFPVGVKVSLERKPATDRKGRTMEAVWVSFPNVFAAKGRSRAFDFEVRLEELDVDVFKVRRTKRVYSSGFYRGEASDEKTVRCPFSVADLPASNGRRVDKSRGRRYRFAVTPCDSFGMRGETIVTEWF